jgi:hypothetical protein
MRFAAWAMGVGLLLAGCQAKPVTISDVHTGQTSYYASPVNAYSGLLDWLQVRPVYSTKQGYGFMTLYANYGWIHPAEAWSFGKKLNYVPGESSAGMCGGFGWHCQR